MNQRSVCLPQCLFLILQQALLKMDFFQFISSTYDGFNLMLP